jgi:glycosyltransferase involved in cell wall biosynthesis
MEGNPNVILEAIASGRPVVATSVGGIPEIMGEEGGALVPPRDAAALAAALGSVLDKSWDAEAIASSRSRSWDTVASELLAIYEKIVSEHKAGIHAR